MLEVAWRIVAIAYLPDQPDATAMFRLRPVDLAEEFRVRALGQDTNALARFIAEHVVEWRDIIDEHGRPLEVTCENLLLLLREPPVLAALLRELIAMGREHQARAMIARLN